MINRITYEELEEKIKFFLKWKIPYKKLSTNERTIVHASGRWGSWMNKESTFKAKELNFIKSVKEHIIKHGTFKKVRNNFKKEGSTGKIKYFFYNKKNMPGDYFENVVEIDLKNCYWETAYKLPPTGLFSKEIYEKGLTVSKKSRLAAIGTCAKVTSVIEFDGEKEVSLPDERSDKTEFLWHTICHKVGRIMIKAAKMAMKKKTKNNDDDFLMFWVDAIVVKGETAKELIKFFKSVGYETTVYKCEWIRFEEKRIVIHSEAKGKWVRVVKEEIIERDGKKYLRRKKVKEWRNERPFPYSSMVSEKEIFRIAANE